MAGVKDVFITFPGENVLLVLATQALVADKVPFWRWLTMFLAAALFKYR